MQRSLRSAIAVGAVGFMLSVALAVTADNHFAGPNVTTIDQLDQIVGTYGSEGNQGSSTFKVWRPYGQHCSGTDCPEKTQNKPAQTNILKLRVVYETSDGTDEGVGTFTRTIKAITRLKDKNGGQQTTDNDCLEGPPTWNATASVSVSSPASGQGGGTGSGGGMLTEQFAHSNNGTPVSWAWPDAQGAKPQRYDDQSSGTQTMGTWVVDPNNPQTHYFWVSATATCTFTGTAREIVVAQSQIKGTAELEVQVVTQ